MFFLLPLALALSMDAFSVAVSIGISGASWKKMIIYSTMVGILHFFMPLLGLIVKNLVFQKIIIRGNAFLGIILLVIATEMIIDFKKNNSFIVNDSSVLLLALIVSIDSFITGVGLATISVMTIKCSIIFLLFSFIFSLCGCILGSKIKQLFPNIAILFGAAILIIMGVKCIFM